MAVGSEFLGDRLHRRSLLSFIILILLVAALRTWLEDSKSAWTSAARLRTLVGKYHAAALDEASYSVDDKTLVIYSGPTSLDARGKNNLYLSNFEYFLANGVDCTSDTVLVVSSEVQTRYAAQVSEINLDCQARYDRRVLLVAKENRCLDMESVRVVLDEGSIVNATAYDYMCVVNCGTTGPHPQGAGRRWTTVFTSKLNEHVKMAGLTINCAGPPHIQSMMYCLDRVGLKVITDAKAVYDCRLNYTVYPPVPKSTVNPVHEKNEIIGRYELGMSREILRAGYGITSHMQPRTLFRNHSGRCSDYDMWIGSRLNETFQGNVPTLNETIFFKTSRVFPDEIREKLNFTDTVNWQWLRRRR